jgi:hypothetical protein
MPLTSGQRKPVSTEQVAEQPSPDVAFPSSQDSVPATTEFPQSSPVGATSSPHPASASKERGKNIRCSLLESVINIAQLLRPEGGRDHEK